MSCAPQSWPSGRRCSLSSRPVTSAPRRPPRAAVEQAQRHRGPPDRVKVHRQSHPTNSYVQFMRKQHTTELCSVMHRVCLSVVGLSSLVFFECVCLLMLCTVYQRPQGRALSEAYFVRYDLFQSFYIIHFIILCSFDSLLISVC